jgi:hypothetical protein
MRPEKGKASSASGPTASASSALEYDLEKIGGPKKRRQGGKGASVDRPYSTFWGEREISQQPEDAMT